MFVVGVLWGCFVVVGVVGGSGGGRVLGRWA